MTKILRNPIVKDVEDFVKSKGFTLSKTSDIDITIDDIKCDKDKETYCIPYAKDDAVDFIREYDAWWNREWSKCFEDINDILDYEFDDWKKYCEKLLIDPQGKIE